MKSYDIITKEYTSRRKKYSDRDFKPLIGKAYSRFKRGVEIRWRDIQDYLKTKGKITLLRDMLIEVPQIKIAIDKLNQLLGEIETTNEMDLQVIYGEYGQGKSQIAQVLEEHFSNKNLYPTLIHMYHFLSTLPRFLDVFTNKVKEHFQNTPALSKIENLLEELKELSLSENFYLMNILDKIIQVIKETTRHGRTILIIFDEFDILLTKPKEFKPWGNLFVRLNDAEDLNLLFVLLLPQATAEQIKIVDNRLQRWDTAFGINSLTMLGKYQDMVPHAIANIMSMKSIISNIQFNNFYLTFGSESLDFQYEKIRNDNIRSVNTWAVELSEMLQKLMMMDWEKYVNDFYKLDNTKKGGKLEKGLRMFLIDSQLPDFKIKNPDTEKFDTFQVSYKNKNIRNLDKVSDGQFEISKIVNKMPVDEIKVAVEIKYTSNGEHTKDQINKIKTLAEGYPLIFFSLGTNQLYYKNLLSEINKWGIESSKIYPVLVIRLPMRLITPLLILENKEEHDYLTKINVLNVWAKRFCPFYSELENFFRNLPDKLLERQLTIRLESLKRIAPKPKIKDLSDYVTEKPQLSSGIQLLCSYLEVGFKTYKTIEVLERDIKKRIEDKHPSILEEFMNKLPRILNELVENEFIIQFIRGERDSIKRTMKWDTTKAASLLYSKYG